MKTKLISVFGALVMMSSAANAVVTDLTFSQQMDAQKQQLRPQAFNFFSDRYVQLQAMKTASLMTFKQQLDSQKLSLRPQQFNPVSDAYYQTHAKAY